ncbi:MAG: hypothetical protein JNN20_04960 [Betaproteobacteria bacterium]|nr:hypothetical protein [Betaproteobacteria bacterium]
MAMIGESFLTAIRQLLWPQKNLFNPIVATTIDVGQSSRSSGVLSAKYAGRYEINIDLSRIVLPYQKAELACKLRLQIISEDHVLVDVDGDIANNQRLGYFSAPDEVPLGKEVRYAITVVAPNPKLQTLHAPVRLSIRHASTK